MPKDILSQVTDLEEHEESGHSFKTPVRYRRLDCFFAFYTASMNALYEILPTEKIVPVPLWKGRCGVALVAFNYHDTSIGPYGEFAVAVPAIVRMMGENHYGVYIHRLPVTTELACVAGRSLWGYPKFVCDMEFESTGDRNAVTLVEEDTKILGLSVKKGGIGIPWSRPLTTFTIKDEQLVATEIQSSSLVRVVPHGLGRLDLGNHWMSDELNKMGLKDRPMVTGDLLDANMVLPRGKFLGLATRGKEAVPTPRS